MKGERENGIGNPIFGCHWFGDKVGRKYSNQGENSKVKG
jgi:hypothetical protein